MASEVVMPQMGFDMEEGTLARWLKKEGDPVQWGEAIAEIETDKAVVEMEAYASGVLLKIVVGEGQRVPVGAVVAYVGEPGEEPPERGQASGRAGVAATGTIWTRAPAEASAATAEVGVEPGHRDVVASPLARRRAAELGIDLALVPATGPGGRIVEADVRAYAEKAKAGPPGTAPAPVQVTGPAVAKVVPVRGLRRLIAEHMKQSLATTAQLTFSLEVDVTEAMALRQQTSRKSGIRITTTDVLLKACAGALVRHPHVNAALVGQEVHYFDEVNIGLAVAVGDGLVVPVLKHVNEKSLQEIAQERDALVARAQKGKLLPDDLAGGTFTLSVLGTVDGFTPILSPGQSAILGVGRVVQKPVVRRGQIVPREMVTLSLTVDHQVIDGAPAASFLRRLQRLLENPAALLV